MGEFDDPFPLLVLAGGDNVVERDSAGECALLVQQLPPVGVVGPYDPRLLDRVLQNITLAQVHALGVDKCRATEWAIETLDTVGLSDRAPQFAAPGRDEH